MIRSSAPIEQLAKSQKRVCLSAIIAGFGGILLALLAFHLGAIRYGNQPENFMKVLLGPKKIPFCIGSEYVDGVTQLNDGSNVVSITMFLPDLSPEDVYDKFHPIPSSSEFWSPQRLAFKHSILDINVTASYRGPGDPTGQLALMQLLRNNKEFAFPASKFPVPGFTEYDDKWGYPSVYYYNGKFPYGITCFGYACSIFEIFRNSLYIEIGIDKTSIPGALEIINKLNHLILSTRCPD